MNELEKGFTWGAILFAWLIWLPAFTKWAFRAWFDAKRDHLSKLCGKMDLE